MLWRDNLQAMEATLAPVNAPLIEALDLNGPLRIAEIGCGGGGTTRALARMSSPSSHIVGYDISPDLVTEARHRVPFDNVLFEVADAETTQPNGAPFDRLVSRFGVMFFLDEARAFTNLARWLGPGGQFAFAVWGRAEGNPWMTAVKDAVRSVVDIPSTDPNAAGPFRYADAAPFLDLLNVAGFSSLTVRDWAGNLPVGGGVDPKRAADFAFSAFSGAKLLSRLSSDDYQTAHDHLSGRFVDFTQNGVVMAPAQVQIITGHGGG